VDGGVVRFVLAGDEAAEADILKAMIHDGFRVVAFGARRRTLEDVFMQVTKGLVQ
jgi:ABC-2 type transport system ATP-binding protein